MPSENIFGIRAGNENKCCRQCRHLYDENDNGFGRCSIHKNGWSGVEVCVLEVCDKFLEW